MKASFWEVLRYAINGFVATAVHFAVLAFNLHVLHFSSAGLANLTASLFGISASFVGSRYFVFPRTGEPIVAEALRFSGLYGAIALLHGAVLLVSADAITSVSTTARVSCWLLSCRSLLAIWVTNFWCSKYESAQGRLSQFAVPLPVARRLLDTRKVCAG